MKKEAKKEYGVVRTVHGEFGIVHGTRKEIERLDWISRHDSFASAKRDAIFCAKRKLDLARVVFLNARALSGYDVRQPDSLVLAKAPKKKGGRK